MLLMINSTRDVWKLCQIWLVPVAHPILAKFPNITHTINPYLYLLSHDYRYLQCHSLLNYTKYFVCFLFYFIVLNLHHLWSPNFIFLRLLHTVCIALEYMKLQPLNHNTWSYTHLYSSHASIMMGYIFWWC
jgi:hypothetical protein